MIVQFRCYLHSLLSDPFDARGVDWPLRRPPLASTTETHHLSTFPLWIPGCTIFGKNPWDLHRAATSGRIQKRQVLVAWTWEWLMPCGEKMLEVGFFASALMLNIDDDIIITIYHHLSRWPWLQQTILYALYSWLMTIIATAITIAYHNNALL